MADYVVGLDLGQTTDYTALCVLEGRTELVELPKPAVLKPDLTVPAYASEREIIRLERLHRAWLAEAAEQEAGPLVETRLLNIFDCVHLERLRGASYVAIVRAVCGLMSELGSGAALVIDRTGVGRAVYDAFVDAKLSPIGVTIHGGESVTREDAGSFRVPKKDLVSVVHRYLGERRLKIAAGLTLRSVLEAELAAFRYKLNAATAHESYAAWREADHDDLVLAVALSLWWADRDVAEPRLRWL